jgi:hypothetical protein
MDLPQRCADAIAALLSEAPYAYMDARQARLLEQVARTLESPQPSPSEDDCLEQFAADHQVLPPPWNRAVVQTRVLIPAD